MSQPLPVMALRKRMKVFGYCDISFHLCPDGFYLITAVEPLSHACVYRRVSLSDMSFLFRR